MSNGPENATPQAGPHGGIAPQPDGRLDAVYAGQGNNALRTGAGVGTARRIVARGLRLLLAVVWLASAFALTLLVGPGLLHEPWHLLVDSAPGGGVAVTDRALTAEERTKAVIASRAEILEGRVRVFENSGGERVGYAAMLVFPSEASAEKAVLSAVHHSYSPVTLAPWGVPVPGLGVLPNAEGEVRHLRTARYVFILETTGHGPAHEQVADTWLSEQQDRAPGPLFGFIETEALPTPTAASGALGAAFAWYGIMSALTGPLSFRILRLTQPSGKVPGEVPVGDAPAVRTIDADVWLGDKRRRAAAGATVRCVGHLLVVVAALRWWWTLGPVPVAPFVLAAAALLLRLGHRTAGSAGWRVPLWRMTRAAGGRRLAAAGGWLLLALCLLMLSLTGSLSVSSSSTSVTSGSTKSAETANTTVILPMIVLMPAAAWALRRCRGRIALNAGQALQDDGRPPVLYLRSFGDDHLRVRTHASGRRNPVAAYTPRRWEPFEEVLAWRLWMFGPLVAVAEPGARHSPLGAAREELGDDVWQEGVARRVEQARLIMVLLGRTRGLAWELGHLHRSGSLGRTVFVMPPVTQADAVRRWEATRSIFAPLGTRLPPLPCGSRYVLAAQVRMDGVIFATASGQSDWSYEAALEALARHGGIDTTCILDPGLPRSTGLEPERSPLF